MKIGGAWRDFERLKSLKKGKGLLAEMAGGCFTHATFVPLAGWKAQEDFHSPIRRHFGYSSTASFLVRPSTLALTRIKY